MEKQDKPFQFEISLSVLNHLGRNLYRNFITVLGEAISNSWDADAENVWIYIDKENNNFVIKDDGIGMSVSDFQDKFLTVGYSKRKKGGMKSSSGRPFIGAKGIGKLALLSCAERISIISKIPDSNYVGGVIDNAGLDNAIKEEMKPDQYSLKEVNLKLFDLFTQKHKKGTIIYFEKTKENVRNTIPYLKKLVALYFRFSLIDKNFNIFVNNEKVTLDDLKDLSESTEFLWNINNLQDPYIDDKLSSLKENKTLSFSETTVKGFIASVNKPRFLKITGTEEKVGIDLFVNGRLREKNILKHLPDFSTRHVASYLYGQIHFDQLDNDIFDKVFTSSREGVVADNIEHKALLKIFKDQVLVQISNEWDEWRLKHDEIGDDENIRNKSKKARYARSLYKESASDYSNADNDVKSWIKELREDAEFNVPAYADCFLSENLIRKYIQKKQLSLTKRAVNDITIWSGKENKNKENAGISFEISRSGDLCYLGMDTLVEVADGVAKQNTASLARDAVDYKPMRNAVGHTALLTDVAKKRLTLVYENIKCRLNILLNKSENE